MSVTVDDHVQRRWRDRVGGAVSKHELTEKWHRGTDVFAPFVDGQARLVDAGDGSVLLVFRDGAVRTVLYPDYDRMIVTG